MNIREFTQAGMLRLYNSMSSEPEPEPELKTADEAMAEMNKLSKALDEAKTKAKKEVSYEKSTAKMSAFGATGLSLFALSLIFSSASGFFPGLAIILCVFGAVFFAMACVGASDKARQKEEQWDSMIEVWEKDLAEATGEWLKIEGIYDFSNPEMPEMP